MKRLLWVSLLLAGIASVILASGVMAAAGGTASTRDGSAQSDRIVIALTGVPAVAAKTLVGWLVSDDGSTYVNTGVLSPDANGNINASFTSPTGQNLTGFYTKFLVSAEDAANAAAAAPAGQVVAEANAPTGEALMHVRHTVYQWEQAPNKTGLITGALLQSRLLSQHAHLMQDALRANNLAMAKTHAEHVVNITVGSKSAEFGDKNGDGQAQNPGDGFGVIEYAKQGGQHAQFAASTADANDYVKLHSMHVIDTAANTVDWATQAKDAALQVLAAADVAAATAPGDTAVRNADLALNGNSNQPTKGQGGATTAYEHAQNMASYVVGAAVPAPAPTGTITGTAVPAPAPTGTITGTTVPAPAPTGAVTGTATATPAVIVAQTVTATLTVTPTRVITGTPTVAGPTATRAVTGTATVAGPTATRAVTGTATVTGTVRPTGTPAAAPGALPSSGDRTPLDLILLAGIGAIALGLGMRRFGIGRSK